MTAYVDITYVKFVGSMPPGDVDALEARLPGTFAQIASSVSRMFDARLQKRYATPFIAPLPEALRWHVAMVVVAELWRKRGYNPSSEVDGLIQQAKLEALAWLKEAADSENGLVELPRNEGALVDASAVLKSGPLSSSEASPYDWIDAQAEAVYGR